MSNDKVQKQKGRQLSLGLVAKEPRPIRARASEELTDVLQEILFLAAMTILEEEAADE